VLSSPRHRPILLWILAIQLVLCGIGVYADDATGKCKPFSNKQSSNSSFLNQMETKNGSESYKYIFRLCEDAGGVPEAGVIQIEKQTTTVIGRYDATEAIGGSDWVMLIYRNGEKYDKHCSQESRRAIVMITCDRNKDLTVVREDRDKNQECFYLFEMDSSAVCPVLESKLSAGSIILIIGFCLVAQFPNYAFWVEVGNMSADGCDFVCRSRNREEPPAYRGLATEP
uniref:MRH domain-containing protein n=1 Tax=Sphaeramia orbicularis TaxID=375764 RepID=A0A673AGE9_9TELE